MCHYSLHLTSYQPAFASSNRLEGNMLGHPAAASGATAEFRPFL